MLSLPQGLIASLVRFINAEVALFGSRTARGSRPRRSGRGVSGHPRARPATSSRRVAWARALSLMRVALRPLQITGIATLLATVSARGHRPPTPDLIERIDLKLPCEPKSPERARAEIREATRRGRL